MLTWAPLYVPSWDLQRTIPVGLRTCVFFRKSLVGLRVQRRIPGRTGEAHWIASCFPIKDRSERLTLAAALVLETTQLRNFRDVVSQIASRFSTDLGDSVSN